MNSSGRARRRAFLPVALVLAFCLIALVGWPAMAQAPDALKVQRDVSPKSGTLGQVEFQVTIVLTGDSTVCAAKTAHQPLDIVLVVDHSPSMFDPAGSGSPGTKMDLLREAANTFVSLVDLRQDRVAVVEFDSVADVVQGLDSNPQNLQTAFDSLQTGNGTSIAQGVEAARRELNSGRARAGASRVIVMMTDGQDAAGLFARGPSPMDAAQAAKQEGIRIITIGLGDDADQNTLRQMATQPSDFHPAPRPQDLADVYSQIAESVRQPVAASSVVFEHNFDQTAFDLIPDSVVPAGTVSNGKITWAFNSIPNGPVSLAYRVKPKNVGSFSIARTDTVKYLRCGANEQTDTQPVTLLVAVQAAPTDTPIPTSTPAPTPTPTRTPRPLVPIPTPPGTPNSFVLNLLCGAPWWRICLGLLLLLFFVWWLWQLINELRQPAGKRQPCRWIPWLLVPLALILGWLILNQLGGAYCVAREGIYFWRIEQSGGNGGIYVTDRTGIQPIREFSAIDQGSCVGCHNVSSTSQQIAAIAGGGNGQVVVRGLDGSRVAIPNVNASYIAWSPDGKKLAVSTAQQDIAIIDIAAQTVEPLDGASDPNWAEEMPAWSPDGQEIAFVRGKDAPNAWTFTGPCDIYLVPATGGTAVALDGASGNGFNYYPAYSPDGRWISFTHHTTGSTTYSAPEAEIYLVPSVGGNPIRIAANDGLNGQKLSNVSNSWATWSLRGDFLAFTSKRNDPAYDIFITAINQNGQSGEAMPLQGASARDVFEHLPYWGVPPAIDPLPGILALWPWLIPFLLVILAWLLCRWLRSRLRSPEVPPAARVRVPPGSLEAAPPIALWQVAPTLVVGVGGSGRWVLTHLKKALHDGGGGQLPDKVRFVLLDTSEREETNVFRDEMGRVKGVEFAGVSLTRDEMLLMGQNLRPVVTESQRLADAALEGWFPYDHYRQLPEGQFDLGATTHGRRPMARAGLIDKIRLGASGSEPGAASPAGGGDAEQAAQIKSDASRLWSVLRQASAEVRDGKRVRIIVVGSLAGGMSGCLFDVAYLARKAAREVVPAEGTVHLEGYFTLPGAFGPVAETAPVAQINTVAAGRELQRFQLSKGFPFSMTYAVGQSEQQATAAHLLGSCDWQLFDDATIFGQPGSPERGPEKSEDPWATVLASMADVITFRMDRAISAGEEGEYRAAVRGRGVTKQAQFGMAMVGSAGSYVYRLPLVDILETVHTQWARKLLHVFLNGNAPGRTVSFEPAEARMPEDPESYARRFLAAEHEAGDAPLGMRAVSSLLGGGEVLTRDITALAIDGGRLYSSYLRQALGLILNGRQKAADGQPEDALERRAPRLGYALAFLQQVEVGLRQAEERARTQKDSASTGEERNWLQHLLPQLGFGKANQAEWQSAIDHIHEWAEITRRSLNSLQGVCRLLLGTEARGGRPAIPGLYSELLDRQARAEARRNQMDQVAVRHYLWSRPISPDKDPGDPANQQDLADEWYRQIEPQVGKYLDRFYWETDRDGTVRLGLVNLGEGKRFIALDGSAPETVQAMADELMRLAAVLTQEWAQKFTIGDVLQTQMSTRTADPAVLLVEQTWCTAQPHLRPALDANHQLEGEHVAAAGIPDEVGRDERYKDIANVFAGLGGNAPRLGRQLDPCDTSLITTTDRTALTLIREHMLMPLIKTPEYEAAWQVYRRNAGSDTDREVDSPLVASVFKAECQALAFERRLESRNAVNQDFRTLHPLVVLALSEPDQAGLYGLAFAAGWVRLQAGTPWLALPEGKEFTLALPDRADPCGGLDWRVAGLLRFALARGDEPLLVAVKRALDQPDAKIQADWRGYIERYQQRAPTPAVPAAAGTHRCSRCGKELRPTAKVCPFCGTPVTPPRPAPAVQVPAGPWRPPFQGETQAVQDVAALAALAAYHRLAPNNWDELVMKRSRRA